MPVADRAARRLAEARRRRARTSLVGDPGPELMFDDRVYKRGALALHALRVGAATSRSLPCCTTGPAPQPPRLRVHRRLHPGRGPYHRPGLRGPAAPVAVRRALPPLPRLARPVLRQERRSARKPRRRRRPRGRRAGPSPPAARSRTPAPAVEHVQGFRGRPQPRRPVIFSQASLRAHSRARSRSRASAGSPATAPLFRRRSAPRRRSRQNPAGPGPRRPRRAAGPAPGPTTAASRVQPAARDRLSSQRQPAAPAAGSRAGRGRRRAGCRTAGSCSGR